MGREFIWLFLRSTLFAVGLILSTVVYALLMPFTFAFAYSIRYRFVRHWSRFNLWWLKVTCQLSYEVKGLENIPSTPAVVLAKHQSTWETLALQHLFIPQIWVVKRELLWVPFFGWSLAMLRPIAINRQAGRRAVQQVIEQGCRRLDSGSYVVIFPEGTRVAPGTRKRYQLGGALLAERSGYAIVPVAHNAGEFWPRRSFIKRPGTISLVIGPIIESVGRQASELNQLVEAWIEGEVARIGNPHLEALEQRVSESTPRARTCSVENT